MTSKTSTLPYIKQTGGCKKTSTFPSLLKEYVPQHQVKKTVHWSRRSVDVKKDRRRGQLENSEDLENVLRKKGQREMKSLRIDAVAKEQLAKLDEYIHRLNEKVVRQRDEIRRRAEELENRMLAQEEERRLMRQQRKTTRISPVHDPDHYKKYPKTQFGKIVLLQDDLRRKGMFRCQEDLDQFWRRKLISLSPSSQSGFDDSRQVSPQKTPRFL